MGFMLGIIIISYKYWGVIMNKDYINKEDIGIHLILDITIKDIFNPNVNLEQTAIDYINECVKLCDMEKIEDVRTHTLPYNDNMVGVTALVPLSTSHISLHTWVEHNYISIDLYSCKYFDVNNVIKYTNKYFNTSEMRIVKIERFIDKPQNIRQWKETYA